VAPVVERAGGRSVFIFIPFFRALREEDEDEKTDEEPGASAGSSIEHFLTP